MGVFIIIALLIFTILAGAVYHYRKSELSRKSILVTEDKLKELEAKIKKNNEEQEDLLRKFDEKSFRFIAINQMAKTLAKEKNLRMLKKLIMDMLVEINSVRRGVAYQNFENSLEYFESKNMGEVGLDLRVNKDEHKEAWDYLISNKVSKLSDLKSFKVFRDLYENITSGYVISFTVSNEFGVEDIQFLIVLGEKSNGEYYEGDVEFLETIGGQIEIILENALKNSYIERKNIELTEKVYDLMTLNYASKLVSSTLDLDEIFKSSIDMFTEVARAVKGAIVYFNKDYKRLEVKAARGDYEEGAIKEQLPLDEDDIYLLKTNHNITLLTNIIDIENNEIVKFYLKNKEFFKHLKSELFIPLITKDEFLGFILLGMRYSEEGYKDENIEVYSTLASQISTSIYNAKLYNMAITDGMTKLYLHRYFKTRMYEEIERCRRYSRKLSVLMTDIDHFKKFNDTYGHQTGDEVLKMVSKILKNAIRKSDIAARYGGEEFAVILPETGIEGSITVAEGIRSKIEKSVLEQGDSKLKVTISIGISTFDPAVEEKDIESLIEKADKALYYSKDMGRNKVSHFSMIKGFIDEGDFSK